MKINSLNMSGKSVAVVGMGDSGTAVARWFTGHDEAHRLVLCDSRSEPPRADVLREEMPHASWRLGGFRTDSFSDCDVLVMSPGVPVSTPAIAEFAQRGGEVIGDVELFARAIAGSGCKVIAITGSNGKSTVTELVGHLCREAGLDTVVAGNIGLPVMAALRERKIAGSLPDVFVLELSSFQLETTFSLHPDAATVLNISEDHLDRYRDLLAYANSKACIFNGEGVQIINRDDAFVRAMARAGRAQREFSLKSSQADYGLHEKDGAYFLCAHGQPLLNFAEMKLPGLHNAANALAALALCEAIGLPREALLSGLHSFRGLPHRVEFVRTIGGVDFFDDSKGTNVGATEAALNGMVRPVVLIAGGDGKGQDFSPLLPALQRIGRAVILIGRDAPVIRSALAGLTVPIISCGTLEEATRMAFSQAQQGDVVLLSPACASLDMFRNYSHRADVFIAECRQIAAEQGV